jgi:hypothetical protein
LKSHASFERQQYVKAFPEAYTKWYRQRTSIKIVAEKLGIHQSEIILLWGMQGMI